MPAAPGSSGSPTRSPSCFPTRGRAIVTSDTIWSPARAAEFVAAMEAGEIDIVVGTQLVTKGYHFPNLTLVGVVDADLGLPGGDLRAAERSFQQIQQVAGRAGRGDKPGRVLVQTHDPDAPVIAALVSGDAPASTPPRPRPGATRRCRRSGGLPRSSSRPRPRWKRRMSRAGSAWPRRAVDDMAVFGPAPAPLAMLRGRHRQRLLVHAARALDVQDVIRDWLDGGRLAARRCRSASTSTLIRFL